MAVNPLYPGYTPRGTEEADISPLYPGYYSGKPMPRPPVSREFVQPINVDFTEMNEVLNMFDYQMRSVPEAIRDRYIADFKAEFKAAIKPKSMSLTDMELYGDQELQGASGINLSLNPEDWRDPKKQLESTVRTWVKSATGIDYKDLSKSNFVDFTNRYDKKMWQHILLENETIENGGNPLSRMERGLAAARSGDMESISDPRRTDNPLFLGNSGVMGHTFGDTQGKKPQKDLYRVAAAAFVEHQSGENTELSRGETHETMRETTFHAINQDLQARLAAGEITDAYDQKLVAVFSGEVAVSQSMKGLMGAGGTKALTKTLGRVANGDKDMKDFVTDLEGFLSRTDARGNPIDNRIDQVRNQIQALRTEYTGGGGIGFDPRQADRRLKKLARMERELTTLEQNLTDVLDQARRGGLSANPRNLQRKLRVAVEGPLGVRIGGSSVLYGSGLIKDWDQSVLEQSLVYTQGSGRDKNIGDVVRSKSKYGARALTLLNYERQQGFTRDAEELLSAVEDEKLLAKYVVPVAKRYLDAYTPMGAINKVMSRNHYGGLVVDNEHVNLAKMNPIRRAAFERVHTHKFSLDEDAWLLEDRLSKLAAKGQTTQLSSMLSKVNISEFKLGGIKGGEWFGVINGDGSVLLHSLMASKENDAPKLLAMILSGKIADVTALTAEQKALVDKVTGVTDYCGKNAKDIAKLQENLEKWRAWLKNNGKRLGIDPNKLEEHGEKILAFFNILAIHDANPDNFGVANAYIGHLQRLWVRLNKIQSTILKSPIGKYVIPLLNLQNYLSEVGFQSLMRLPQAWLKRFLTARGFNVAAMGLSKAFAAFLGSMLGGVGVVLTPIIEKILGPLFKILLKKVFDFGTKFAGNLLKGNFFKAFEEIEKTAMTYVRVGLSIAFIPVAIILAFISLHTGSVAISTPHTEPSKNVSRVSGTGPAAQAFTIQTRLAQKQGNLIASALPGGGFNQKDRFMSSLAYTNLDLKDIVTININSYSGLPNQEEKPNIEPAYTSDISYRFEAVIEPKQELENLDWTITIWKYDLTGTNDRTMITSTGGHIPYLPGGKAKEIMFPEATATPLYSGDAGCESCQIEGVLEVTGEEFTNPDGNPIPAIRTLTVTKPVQVSCVPLRGQCDPSDPDKDLCCRGVCQSNKCCIPLNSQGCGSGGDCCQGSCNNNVCSTGGGPPLCGGKTCGTSEVCCGGSQCCAECDPENPSQCLPPPLCSAATCPLPSVCCGDFCCLNGCDGSGEQCMVPNPQCSPDTCAEPNTCCGTECCVNGCDATNPNACAEPSCEEGEACTTDDNQPGICDANGVCIPTEPTCEEGEECVTDDNEPGICDANGVCVPTQGGCEEGAECTTDDGKPGICDAGGNCIPETDPGDYPCVLIPWVTGWDKGHSYRNESDGMGHGTNYYWCDWAYSCGNSCEGACSFPIPWYPTKAEGPFTSNNVCCNESPKKSFYGYALDVFPGSWDVVTPSVGGVAEWDKVRCDDIESTFTVCCSGSCQTITDMGVYLYLSGSGNGSDYKLAINHMESCPSGSGPYKPGDVLGTINNMPTCQGNWSHIHLELEIDGDAVMPESHMCSF